MPIICPNAGSEFAPVPLEPDFQGRICTFLVSVAGVQRTTVIDQNPSAPARCCNGCSGADDGRSHISLLIDFWLGQRIVLKWQRPGASTASAYMLSLDAAIAALKARADGAQKCEDALVAAVANGMPPAQAEALATAHGIALD